MCIPVVVMVDQVEAGSTVLAAEVVGIDRTDCTAADSVAAAGSVDSGHKTCCVLVREALERDKDIDWRQLKFLGTREFEIHQRLKIVYISFDCQAAVVWPKL